MTAALRIQPHFSSVAGRASSGGHGGNDEAARIERVMAIVGAEIARELRRIRRRKRPAITLAEILRRTDTGTPLLAARWFENYEAARKPDFSPDFLSNVKHPAGPKPQKAYGARTDCAALCGVSVDWFDRNVDRLMREEAFPREREGGGQRRWNLALVVAWSADPANHDVLKRARAAHAKKGKARW